MFGKIYSRESLSLILIYTMYKYVMIIILIMIICIMNAEDKRYQLKIIEQIPTDQYESPQSPKVKLYWFHRPSCPYCVEMKDAWRDVENHLTSTNIKSEKIDIGKLSDNMRHAMFKKHYNVQTVPAIIKEYADGTYDKYDGARTTKDIISWSKQ